MDDLPQDQFQGSVIRPIGEATMVALADSRALMSGQIYWPSLILASGLLATTGPYQTFGLMSLWERLAFWTPTTIASVVALTFLAYLVRALDRHQKLHWLFRANLVAFVGLAPVAFLAWLVIELEIGTTRPALQHILELAVLSSPVVFGVTISLHYLVRRSAAKSALRDAKLAKAVIQRTSSATPAAPFMPQPNIDADFSSRFVEEIPNRLRDRMPPELDTEIVCVQAQNHYINVTTTLGTARILMRMGDAEADLTGLNGLRVHRSWWVNLPHIAGTQPRGASISLTLSTGQTVPVGRNLRHTVLSAMQNLEDLAAQ